MPPHWRLGRNIVVTLTILSCVFYGLTAFPSKVNGLSRSNIIYALNHSPIRFKYNLTDPFPQINHFSISVSSIDVSKYRILSFSIRGTQEGFPDVVKVAVKNRKNETAYCFIKGVRLKWQKFDIPLTEFKTISDWTNITDVSFVFEAWNTQKKRGIVLIDDICFSS